MSLICCFSYFSDSRRPVCECGSHIVNSRSRMGMLNDPARNSTFISGLKPLINKDTVCLIISDGSMLGHMAAMMGAKAVYSLQCDTITYNLMKRYKDCNKNTQNLHIINKHVQDLTEEDLSGNKVM